MNKYISAVVCLLFMATAVAQQADITYEAAEVAPGVYVLTAADGKFGGGNMALLVGDEQVVLIDDAMTQTAPAALEAIQKLAGRAPDFVINTHMHGDHVGGNALLQGNGAYAIAHDNIRKRLLDDSSGAGGDGGLPIITFDESVTLHVNGNELHVFHIHDAHTDGDGVIHFRDLNLIHAGDLMFNYLFPFIDHDNGGSVRGYIRAQRQLIALADDDTIIIPGHGDIASRDDLRTNLNVLVEGRSRIIDMYLDGMSEDEVVAANPLADYHEQYNWSFITTERMTRTHYRDLTRR